MWSMLWDILAVRKTRCSSTMWPPCLLWDLLWVVHWAHKLFNQSPVNILLIKEEKNLMTRPRNTSFLFYGNPYWLQFGFIILNIRKFMFGNIKLKYFLNEPVEIKNWSINWSTISYETLCLKNFLKDHNSMHVQVSSTIFHEGRNITYVVHYSSLWVYYSAWQFVVEFFF